MGKTPQKKPGKSIDQPDFSTSTFETLPAFDTTALQQLTKKVNVGLKQLEEDSKSSKKKRQHASKVDQKDKSKVATEPSALVPGKKRTINGTVKAVHKINGSNGTKIRSTSRGQETNTSNAPVKNSESNTNLIDEIRALGGDNEDLKLIVGVDSDSEAEAADFSSKKERTTNQQLQQSELQSFVKSLGINDLQDVEESPVISKPVPTQKREKPSNQKDRVKPKQHSVLTGTESHELKPVKSSKPAKSSKPGTSLVSPLLEIMILQLITKQEFEPRPDWHATQLPQIVARAEHKVQLPTDLSSRIYESAISLLEKENEVYASKHLGSNSSRRFLSTIMSSGTLSDKVSALTLVIQESPLHNIKAFESLIGLARKRSRGQAVTALGALKDLLADGTLLPSERRLRAFHLQPELAVEFINHQRWNQGDQLPGNLKVSHLLYWAYESWLKDRYFEILGILETWCNDEVQYARARAVGYVFELLKEKPEQESNLLRLLVNKLGDPDRKIASKTSYLLLQLQTSHPLMKQTIFSAIESELFRPGQSLHARYYAIITLNQTILSTKEDSIAGKLLDLYFSLFVGLLKRPDRAKAVKPPLTPTPAHTVKYNKRGDKQGGGSEKGKKALSREQLDEAAEKQEEDLNEKMISAVLTGVNRAIPFSNLDTSRSDEYSLT
jgi:ribosome biogenesis protein MAK21